MAPHSSWGPGWPNCQYGEMVTLRRDDGFARAFHRDIVELFALCIDVTEALGYDVIPAESWGFSCRAVAGTDSASFHSYGLAADINAPRNPRRQDRKFQSDIPADVIKFWEGVGFTWGGRWSWPDPMHFEWRKSKSAAASKLADLRKFFGWDGVKPAPSPAPTTGGYAVPVTVKLGSTGRAVRKCQGLLLAHGMSSVRVDGAFGPITKAAVESRQSAWGLARDGIVGPITWKALIER